MKWIVLGNLLTMAYKSMLLPTLVTISYDKTLDTVEDLFMSGLPLMMPGGSSVYFALKADERPIMKKIYNESITYPYNGKPPQQFWEM